MRLHRNKLKWFIFFVFNLFCYFSLGGLIYTWAMNDQDLLSQLETLVTKEVSAKHFTGAVIAFSNHGKIFKKAIGHTETDLMSPVAQRMTSDHIFDLASLTKVFATTFALMLLIDQNQINLDAAIAQYLPIFNTEDKRTLTVSQLLTHTAGFSEWKPLYLHCHNREACLQYIAKLPLKFIPGFEKHYSDLGFIVLGFLVEQMTGVTIDQFISKNLYQKMDLKNTLYRPLNSGIGPLVATSYGNPFEYRMIQEQLFGYAIDENALNFKKWRDYPLMGEVNDGNAFHVMEEIAGHAGLFSNAKDLIQLMELLHRQGEWNGNQLIQSGTGLGWFNLCPSTLTLLSQKLLKEGVFWHSGFTGTFACVHLKKHLSVVVLTNRQRIFDPIERNYANLKPLWEELIKLIE